MNRFSKEFMNFTKLLTKPKKKLIQCYAIPENFVKKEKKIKIYNPFP